jgi:hypothetical protein
MRIFQALRRLIRNSDKVDGVIQGIDNQSKQLAEVVGLLQGVDEVIHRTDGVTQGIDNQSKQLAEVVGLLRGLTELHKAQLVMQRDQSAAIDSLAESIEASVASLRQSVER